MLPFYLYIFIFLSTILLLLLRKREPIFSGFRSASIAHNGLYGSTSCYISHWPLGVIFSAEIPILVSPTIFSRSTLSAKTLLLLLLLFFLRQLMVDNQEIGWLMRM